jgi:hypothetical protein
VDARDQSGFLLRSRQDSRLRMSANLSLCRPPLGGRQASTLASHLLDGPSALGIKPLSRRDVRIAGEVHRESVRWRIAEGLANGAVRCKYGVDQACAFSRGAKKGRHPVRRDAGIKGPR